MVGNAIAVEREEKKTNENFPKAKGNFPQCQVILNNVLERSTVLPLNLTGRWTSIRYGVRILTFVLCAEDFEDTSV